MSGRRLRCLPRLVALFISTLSTLIAADRKSAAPPASPEITKLGYYSVPLERDYPSPTIWGAVNGTRALFLIDTGFTYTTIDREVAPHFEPQPEQAKRLMGPLLGPLEGTNWMIIRRLTLYRARFLNTPARVMDLSIGREPQARQHGILGGDFLRRNRAIIFAGEDRLLLNASPLESGEQVKLDGLLRVAGFTEIAMENLSSVAWVVPVRIGDTDLKLMVDTGAARTLLDGDFAKQLNVRGRGFGLKLTGVESRETKARRATVPDLQIGSYAAPESKIVVGNAGLWYPGENGRSQPAPHAAQRSMQGMLGYDFLQKHSAVIDCQGSKLWLRAPRR